MKGTKPAAADQALLILLVDDFQDNREMYATYLKHSGMRVAEAATGHETLEQAFRLLPDLVVMDLSLPGIDGWEATRRLEADERWHSPATSWRATRKAPRPPAAMSS